VVSTFKTLEQAGWTEKAAAYDDHFVPITRQAIDPILDAIGDVAGLDLLDIACGSGDLAQAAVQRGALTTGIDFAPTMIEVARSKVPEATFLVGDAEAMAVEDRAFDAAACAFGLWHLAEPDQALAEASRVLRCGGRFVYTTWLAPEDGFDLMDMLIAVIKVHGRLDVDLPSAPPPFRFAARQEAEEALSAQGFSAICFEKRTAWWHGANGQQLLDLVYKSIVRAPMLIDAQAPEARAAIKTELRERVEAMRCGGRIAMRWPYALVSATKDTPRGVGPDG
jgi:SAM-dependent methyltransferase